MEGEKYAFSGQLRETEDAALLFLFIPYFVFIDFYHTVFVFSVSSPVNMHVSGFLFMILRGCLFARGSNNALDASSY